MKIKNFLVLGYLAFTVSCSIDDLTSTVDDQSPEFQSCFIEEYNTCAEASTEDLTFKEACEGNGDYKEEPCSDVSVVLKCEGVSAKGLNGDVFLYDERQISLLKTFGKGDACVGAETILKTIITE